MNKYSYATLVAGYQRVLGLPAVGIDVMRALVFQHTTRIATNCGGRVPNPTQDRNLYATTSNAASSRTDVKQHALLRSWTLAPLLALTVVLVSASSASAETLKPWWGLSSSTAPVDLRPGACEGPSDPQVLPQCGQVVVRAINLGDLPVSGSTTPVSVTDVLPVGVVAKGIARTYTASGDLQSEGHGTLACSGVGSSSVTCSWSAPFALEPQELLEIAIEVEVGAGVSTGAENEVQISGGEGYVCEKQEGGAFSTSFCAGGAAPASGRYEAHLTGQEVAATSLRRAMTVGSTPPAFGVEEYSFENENEGGAFDTQAGSHPFQQTTNLAFNQGTPEGAHGEYLANPPALPKDVHFRWPAGLIGNTTAIPQCTEAEFSKELEGGGNTCPADTAIGVASVSFVLPHFDGGIGLRTEVVPVFNLVPGRGGPARIGFGVAHATVLINPSVRTGRDYGITVNVENISQLVVLVSSRVTVWGVPGDPAHDNSRGWGCVEEGAFVKESSGVVPPCTPEGQTNPPPFLSLPTSCTGPLQTSVRADSWQEPTPEALEAPVAPLVAMPALGGCNRLPFAASMEVAPDVQEASSPTGLAVKVHIPQEASLDATGLAPSEVRDTTVTLPEGITVNPANANGLQACTTAEIGFEKVNPETRVAEFTPKLPEPLEPGVNFCPDASKLANATIDVPVLAHPLKGAVYLASPQNFSTLTGAPPENPFESLVAMYLVAEDPISGVLIKLPGKVSLSPTGQLTTTFENTPQAPFENLELEFFGGERAPLATPALCRRPGEAGYVTNASFTPWSGNAAWPGSSEFDITSGAPSSAYPNGGPCPNPTGDQSPSSLQFSPSLASGTTNNNAGAFSNLTTTLSRPSGDQNIASVTLHYPAGLSGIITGVPLCPEAQANAGTCSGASQIGETIVSVGLGGDPYTVTGGKVYLTEKYKGAPYGLSIVNPAKAGPFDLQEGRPVVVRAKIEVNPATAALTVTTGQIPTIIEGIPLQIQHVNVLIDRNGFTFNPTNCTPTAVTGTVVSEQGASSPVSEPFKVTNCQALKFEPKFSASTSSADNFNDLGASLTTKVSEPAGSLGTQANIAKVKVELPIALPSRLTTLQKACLARVFEANPAGCPPASFIGHATVHTQLLPVPLTGPAIFVSHGGEAFPSLIMVLQGYGVKIELVGTTYISPKGITSTTFKAVPDQPFETFELTLPTGKFSALAAIGNVCKPTKTETVKKQVAVKRHGKTIKVTKKVSEKVAAPLLMPTEFIGQNGAEFKQTTKISVTGCKVAKPAAKEHKKAKGKGHKK
jgi:hypothetical protein